MERIEEMIHQQISFAPMLDVTNTYFLSFIDYFSFQRYMMRQLTRRCTLYSEMFVAETLIYSRYTDDIIE